MWVRSGKKSVCLHPAYLESLIFLAAAGLLDIKEQGKPFVCLKKPNLSRRPNEDMEGQSQMDGWLGCSLEKSLLTESLIPIATVQYVLLLLDGFYLNLQGQQANVVWMYLKLLFVTRVVKHVNLTPLSTYFILFFSTD